VRAQGEGREGGRAREVYRGLDGNQNKRIGSDGCDIYMMFSVTRGAAIIKQGDWEGGGNGAGSSQKQIKQAGVTTSAPHKGCGVVARRGIY
jgi:hypothetical protein